MKIWDYSIYFTSEMSGDYTRDNYINLTKDISRDYTRYFPSKGSIMTHALRLDNMHDYATTNIS